MGFAGPSFIIAIIAMCMGAWVITTWIRAKHGYPITDDWGNTIHPKDSPDAARQIELLSTENAGLKGQVSRLEERIAVLERIATDPAERTAREIEKLR
jgi:hypothetical protein